MTLTINVPPDVEQALREKAQRSGKSITEFAAALLSQVARLDQDGGSLEHQAEVATRLAALDQIGRYDTRARAGLPPLSDEASSRESTYEGRGL